MGTNAEFRAERRALASSELKTERKAQHSSLGTSLLGFLSEHPRKSIFVLAIGLAFSAALASWGTAEPFTRSMSVAFAVLFSCLLGSIFMALPIVRSFRLISDELDRISTKLSELGIHPGTSGQVTDTDSLRPADILSNIAGASRASTDQLPDMIQQLICKFEQLIKHYDLMTTNIAASVVIRDASGTLQFSSPYTQVLTGYPLEDLADDKADFFEDLIVDEDKERYHRAAQVAKLGEDILVRYRIQHRSGLRLWLETRLVPVCDMDDNVTSIMGVTIDVTDSLNYQKLIEQQNRDLNDFAYMVSHDLKAPIFTIKGMASAVIEDCTDILKPDDMELLRYIIDGADRLERLVASVIEYSSLSTKESRITEVDLNTSLLNVCSDLSELIKIKVARLSIEPNLPVIRGDPVRIYQVFSNLIGNALKYSSPERQPEIEIRTRYSGPDSVMLDVKDNGIGVPAAKLDEIFRPYRRAHATEVEGSGIGLACVKKIIDQLGGNVSVQSVEHEGSTFSVEFPAPHPAPRTIPSELLRCFEKGA